MTIEEIFAKATSEDGSLTVDAFNAIVKENKVKLADLSEGHYVAKQKYEDDLAAKDVQINGLNETLGTRDSDLTKLQEQLKNAGTDQAKLDELTNSFTELQSKYENDTNALKEQLSAQSYEFAVRDYANKQKFSSGAAKRDFISSMLNKKLPMESGSIMGADDFMKVYAKENADAFMKEVPKAPEDKPQFTSTATGDKKGGAKMSLTEQMMRKNEDPNFVISFD